MKNLIFAAIMFLAISCNEKSKELKEAEMLQEMAKDNVEMTKTYGNDARAKMILKYGQEKMNWFDSATKATSAEFDLRDSIEQVKIDSINALLKSDSIK